MPVRGRSREWVEEHGDPRSGNVDPIDWVEMIPFTETRNYVQKVMQNVHVYRSRLAPKTMHAMTADLRARLAGRYHARQFDRARLGQLLRLQHRRTDHRLRLSDGSAAAYRDIRFTSADGLALYGRDYPANSDATPVLCLAGLTRNVRDFEPLARMARRIAAPHHDGLSRPRTIGLCTPIPSTYRPDVELADALRLLDHLGHRARQLSSAPRAAASSR